eukprot:6324485-Amphidinium_carterae.1
MHHLATHHLSINQEAQSDEMAETGLLIRQMRSYHDRNGRKGKGRGRGDDGSLGKGKGDEGNRGKGKGGNHDVHQHVEQGGGKIGPRTGGSDPPLPKLPTHPFSDPP